MTQKIYRVRTYFTTLADATAKNYVLREGELWTEKHASTGQSTGRRKVGDGTTPFTSLPFEPSAASSTAASVTFTPAGTIAATDVQAAIEELDGDSRMSNSRTPTTHAASHGDGGSDEITVSQDQVTGLGTALAGKENSGAAAAAVTAHEAASDPHPGYLTQTEGDGRYRQTATALTDSDIPAGIARDSEVTAAISAHEGAADPHPGYLTAAEGNAAYAPIAQGVTNGNSHDHSGGDGAQIAYGSLSGLPTLHDSVTLGASVQDVLELTGQELTADDPGGDRLVFWDDSAGKLTHLTLGTNLSITGTTLDAAGGGGGDVTISGTPSAGQAAEWASGTTIAGVAVTGTGSYVKGTEPALSLPRFSTQATVTAGTNAQGQGALTADINVVTTAANNPSGVTLPAAVTGMVVTIANRGANNINVYPASGGTIDSRAINTSDLIRVGYTRTYYASSSTQWYSSAEQTTLGTIAGFGTGVAAALAIATGSAGAPVLFNGAGGTPTSLTLTNATGLPAAGVTGLGSLATQSALGNITSAGAIGSTANLPVITTTGGALTVGSFGTTANTFCEGNDSRLSDERTPTAHNQAWSTITSTPTTLSGYGITNGATSGAVTGSGLTMATARILGRTTASTGAVEEISIGANLTLSGGVLSATGGGGSLTVQDEGSTLSAAVTTINFTGAGVTATGTSTVTVNIPGGGGGGGDAFSTIAVAGQSNVVADSSTDTLTLAAGFGMRLTTDASTDTVTMAATGPSLGQVLAITYGMAMP